MPLIVPKGTTVIFDQSPQVGMWVERSHAHNSDFHIYVVHFFVFVSVGFVASVSLGHSRLTETMECARKKVAAFVEDTKKLV